MKYYVNGEFISSEDASIPFNDAGFLYGYGLFENSESYKVDFLMMGSANYDKESAQALANKLIAVADIRKDALAFISPYRKAFITDTSVGTVTVNNDETITENVLERYLPRDLVEDILSGKLEFSSEPDTKDITILFSDLV